MAAPWSAWGFDPPPDQDPPDVCPVCKEGAFPCACERAEANRADFELDMLLDSQIRGESDDE